jgi:triacylglycerol lipase
MIILISGWAGFRASLLPLEHGLRKRLGRDVARVDLGLGLGCIRQSAERAAEQLDRITRGRRRERVDIVGYSMGGLIATYWLKFFDHGRSIRSVITLGTPHRGSPAAHLARGWLARVSASISQMSPQSEFLSALAAADVPIESRLLSIAATGDGVVPAHYAELPRRSRQSTHLIGDVSHLGLLFSPAVIDVVESWLDQTFAARAAARPSGTLTWRSARQVPAHA